VFPSLKKYRAGYIAATSRIEPWYTVVIVPIYQEILYRWIPFIYIYPLTGYFWTTGAFLSLLFALTHTHLGKWFVLYAFVGGVVLWYLLVVYGLLIAIVVHAVINILDIKFGWRKLLQDKSLQN